MAPANVIFENGQTVHGETLIATDGAGSAVQARERQNSCISGLSSQRSFSNMDTKSCTFRRRTAGCRPRICILTRAKRSPHLAAASIHDDRAAKL